MVEWGGEEFISFPRMSPWIETAILKCFKDTYWISTKLVISTSIYKAMHPATKPRESWNGLRIRSWMSWNGMATHRTLILLRSSEQTWSWNSRKLILQHSPNWLRHSETFECVTLIIIIKKYCWIIYQNVLKLFWRPVVVIQSSDVKGKRILRFFFPHFLLVLYRSTL